MVHNLCFPSRQGKSSSSLLATTINEEVEGGFRVSLDTQTALGETSHASVDFSAISMTVAAYFDKCPGGFCYIHH